MIHGPKLYPMHIMLKVHAAKSYCPCCVSCLDTEALPKQIMKEMLQPPSHGY